ncbi:MAG: hypothetical protein GY790_13150 [Bacteroidetes bacterium]|nr:hypothetical protein [Bacteroidota bacterium]
MSKRAVLTHILIWIVWFVLVFLGWRFNGQFQDIPYMISSTVIMAFWWTSSFYFFYLYLVPRYLEKKRILVFIVFALLFVVGVMPLLVQLLFKIHIRVFGEQVTSINPAPTSALWGMSIMVTAFWSGLGMFFRFGSAWFRNIRLKKDLENKNLLSELKTLKSKLNPHLLFNTLNNIDTLIRTNPEQASDALSKLSDLLRYVIYDTETEEVSIQEEIDNIQKYIELEKIRLIHPDNVEFTADVKNEIEIPPMIFLPFVENGFKHSNLNNPEHKLEISISENANGIIFHCINQIHDRKQNNKYSGIGLELAKKRLDLLFPDSHQLKIGQVDNKFHVELKLELSK